MDEDDDASVTERFCRVITKVSLSMGFMIGLMALFHVKNCFLGGGSQAQAECNQAYVDGSTASIFLGIVGMINGPHLVKYLIGDASPNNDKTDHNKKQ